MKMKIDFTLNVPSLQRRRELQRQTSGYESFSKDKSARRVNMCDNYQKLDDNGHMFCSAVQFLF